MELLLLIGAFGISAWLVESPSGIQKLIRAWSAVATPSDRIYRGNRQR